MTTPSPAKILVLDDEAELRQLLQRYLGEQGFQVRTLADSSQLYKLLQRESFDALVLDLMMPNEDGLSVCRNLRAQGETLPIIMLTARGDPLDRIIGLEMGADDYLAKPFTPRELVARIQAILRRQRLAIQPVAPHKLSSHSDTVSFGDFVLNLETQTLTRNGEVLPLSSTEFLLLRAFIANAGRTLGRERLIELTRGRDCEASDRSIDVQVLRLRRLLETDTSNPQYLRTVWGSGYVFIPEGKAETSA